MPFIVFDYDGVIIDSSLPAHTAAQKLHATLGLPPISLEAATQRWIGPSMNTTVRWMISEYSIDSMTEDEMAQHFFDEYVTAAPSMTTAFSGMPELLSALVERGTPIALATMKARSEFDAMSGPLPCIDRFEVVACPPSHLETTSSKKILVAEALDQLAARDQMIGDGTMVGDRGSDIEAGKTHGMRTIGVTWGAGAREELSAAAPDEIVDTPAELTALLLDD